jgi:hypothetical protein
MLALSALSSAMPAAAIAAAAVWLAVPAGAAPAAGPAVSGTEHFQAVSTSAAATRQGAIFFGVFTTAGVDHITGFLTDTFVFPAGTFKLKHSMGTGTQKLNPKTCLFTLSMHGNYRIFGGTGKYAGIRGRGTYQIHVLAITARSAGKCTMTKPPVAFQRILKAFGPVTL